MSHLKVVPVGENAANASPAGTVIRLRPRAPAPDKLTMRDRMDIAQLREEASARGFERLVIHEPGIEDGPHASAYLGIYPRGEAWARYGISRQGNVLTAWVCASGRDIGRFATMGEALCGVIHGASAVPPKGAQIIRMFG